MPKPPSGRGGGRSERCAETNRPSPAWSRTRSRHTFASGLVMTGVDLRTVQSPGGWRTLAMVQRYRHLAPDYLHAAVERLVQRDSGVAVSRKCPEAKGQEGGVS